MQPKRAGVGNYDSGEAPQAKRARSATAGWGQPLGGMTGSGGYYDMGNYDTASFGAGSYNTGEYGNLYGTGKYSVGGSYDMGSGSTYDNSSYPANSSYSANTNNGNWGGSQTSDYAKKSLASTFSFGQSSSQSGYDDQDYGDQDYGDQNYGDQSFGDGWSQLSYNQNFGASDMGGYGGLSQEQGRQVEGSHDDDSFSDDLALLRAAEKQFQKGGMGIDFAKLKLALQIVGQSSSSDLLGMASKAKGGGRGQTRGGQGFRGRGRGQTGNLGPNQCSQSFGGVGRGGDQFCGQGIQQSVSFSHFGDQQFETFGQSGDQQFDQFEPWSGKQSGKFGRGSQQFGKFGQHSDQQFGKFGQHGGQQFGKFGQHGQQFGKFGQRGSQQSGKFGQRGGRGGKSSTAGNKFYHDFTGSNQQHVSAFSGHGKGAATRGQRGAKQYSQSWNPQGNQVAPVHSMSSVRPLNPSKMSVAEKIRRLCLFIRNDVEKANDIQTIENALTGSKLGLKSEYTAEELMRVSGKAMYTGRLCISGVFLARSVGANKKEMKHECYRKAMEVIKTKTVTAILSLKDLGAEAIRKELQDSIDAKDGTMPVPLPQPKIVVDTPTEKPRAAAKPTRNPVYFGGKVGFEKLIDYLLYSEVTVPSKISELEQAFTASHCGLSHKYEEEEIRLVNGRVWFKGRLFIANVVIGGGSGPKKKDAKLKTYENAVEALKTKPVHLLLKGVSLAEVDDILDEMPEASEECSVSFFVNVDTKKRLDSLIETIKKNTGKETVVNLLDVTAHHLQLVPTCLYKKVETANQKYLLCELYMDNILIASGEGEKRKEAQHDAYTKAFDVLSTTSSEKIIAENRHLQKDDMNDPNIVEIWVKGRSRSGDSNMPRLKRFRADPVESGKENKDLIIMEHHQWAEDRKGHAFCILNQSATQNGMLLEWNIVPCGMAFRCTMQLQKQQIGEAFATSKNSARNLAAADALFRLYATQPVIMSTSRDESKHWIPFEDIKEKAESLKEVSAELGGDDMVPVVTDEDSAASTEKESDKNKPPLTVSKWIVKVFEEMLNDYVTKDNLEELVLGPGFSAGEKKQLNLMVRRLNLRIVYRQMKEHAYCAIFKKWSPEDIHETLKKHNGASGKYFLISKDKLPSHDDIKEVLVCAEKNIKQVGTAPTKVPKVEPTSFENEDKYVTPHSTFFGTSGLPTPGLKSFNTSKQQKGGWKKNTFQRSSQGSQSGSFQGGRGGNSFSTPKNIGRGRGGKFKNKNKKQFKAGKFASPVEFEEDETQFEGADCPEMYEDPSLFQGEGNQFYHSEDQAFN